MAGLLARRIGARFTVSSSKISYEGSRQGSLWDLRPEYRDRMGNSNARSYLFTVRVWPGDMGNGPTAMRSEVRYVVGGGVRYFQEWGTLVAYLADKVQELEGRPKGGDKTANHVDV